jgi:hypothetical protein
MPRILVLRAKEWNRWDCVPLVDNGFLCGGEILPERGEALDGRVRGGGDHGR